MKPHPDFQIRGKSARQYLPKRCDEGAKKNPNILVKAEKALFPCQLADVAVFTVAMESLGRRFFPPFSRDDFRNAMTSWPDLPPFVFPH